LSQKTINIYYLYRYLVNLLVGLVRRLYAILLTLIITGCQGSDISIVDQRETRVVIDSFIQTGPIEEIDVLISLDTSGSMYDNFADVASGMELLRLDIESLTLDYQFGYITMDPTELSYIGPYDSSASAIDMLMAPNLLSTTGLEEGFAATYSFIMSEDGKSFIRPEADFLLFLVSDEEEQSNITAEIFQEWLQEEFADVRHDVAVVTQLEDSACGTMYNVGYKYEELATLYNKNAIDICDEDWSVWLSESSYLTEVKDYIYLSESSPILGSIIVYIDNKTTYDWQYSEELNSVQLSFIPNYGSLVEVGYRVYI